MPDKAPKFYIGYQELRRDQRRDHNTRLNIKIENNSTSNGAFYQSEWVKNNSSWVSLVFRFIYVAANASELFCMVHLTNIERFLYYSNLSF